VEDQTEPRQRTVGTLTRHSMHQKRTVALRHRREGARPAGERPFTASPQQLGGGLAERGVVDETLKLLRRSSRPQPFETEQQEGS
jgi:hypothetical protein